MCRAEKIVVVCHALRVWAAAVLAWAILPSAVAFCATEGDANNARVTPRGQLERGYARIGLHFEPAPDEAGRSPGFITHGSGYSAFLTREGALLIPARKTVSKTPPAKSRATQGPAQASGASRLPALVMKLVDANRYAKFEPVEKLAAQVNYFIGNDPKRWRTGVPTYAKLAEREVWPGTDLVYYGSRDRLECDFVVGASADAKRVRLGFEGAADAWIDARGDLVLKAAGAELKMLSPRVYQIVNGRKKTVQARYLLASVDGQKFWVRKRRITSSNFTVSFDIAAYDSGKPLMIDPILRYSSFFGGSGDDRGLAVALDQKGNAYVAGSTNSISFPVKNAFQRSCKACLPGGALSTNAFVAKFHLSASSARASLVYATYLGGGGDQSNLTGDSADAIALDDSGHIFVAGTTSSADFPTTPGAFQKSCPSSASCNTAFVTELNPAATDTAQLVYSTYLGGSASEIATSITVPLANVVYVAGSTSSSDFPTTGDALQPTCNDCSSPSTAGFVSQLNPSFIGRGSLIYSTFLGGSTSDAITSIVAPRKNAIYLAGFTSSSDFPTTTNAFQTSCPACPNASNAFVAILGLHIPPSQQLLYSTYLGGSGNSAAATGDRANGIAIEGQSIFVTGTAASSDFPTTAGAFQGTCPSAKSSTGCSAAFVASLIPAFSGKAQLDYSTYLGGSGNRTMGTGDSAAGIAADFPGDVYVTGTATSADFPITSNAAQKHCSQSACRSNAFVAKLDPFIAGPRSLEYSSYLGGSNLDHGNAIAVDSVGHVSVTGVTHSSDFPLTARAFQGAYSGGGDAFVSAFNLVPRVTVQPRHVNFGREVVGRTKGPRSIVLLNPPNSHGLPLEFRGFALTSGDFDSTSCFGNVLPGRKCVLKVTFTPTTTGRRTGRVAVIDNAPGGTEIISLSGVGVQPRPRKKR